MGLISTLLLLVIVGVVIASLVRRGTPSRSSSTGQGDDLLAYLLLALAMGVSAFSLASLGQAAFPTGGFVHEPERQVATALAGLVVAGPITVVLWRRQRGRRVVHPRSPGWTLYLAVTEAVFLIAAVVAAIATLRWLLADTAPSHWTDLIVFVGFVAFHEVAARVTPPRSEGADLPRLVGSAIGLVTAAIGLILVLHTALRPAYAWLTGGESTAEPWLSVIPVLAVGALVWWYRWLRPWSTSTRLRDNWAALVATAGLLMALGAALVVVSNSLVFLLTRTAGAASHFDFLPPTLAVAVTGSAIWWHHRSHLGEERTDPVRSYEYLATAFAVSAIVGGIAFLARAALESPSIVGGSAAEAISAAVVIGFGLTVWGVFWARAQRQPREIEAPSAPRRGYLLGLGVVMAVTGAIALITTLVGVFQLLLGIGGISDEFPTTISLTIASGLAAWHLLGMYANDKKHLSSGEVVAPFDVVVICSHPGSLPTRLHERARVRVVYRGDDAGIIDDAMVDRIVAEVGNRSSFVWVDESGFRVAPAR